MNALQLESWLLAFLLIELIVIYMGRPLFIRLLFHQFKLELLDNELTNSYLIKTSFLQLTLNLQRENLEQFFCSRYNLKP